jgi:rhodanese-related sulfurtransferase
MEHLSTKIGLGLALVISVGLAGCGASSPSGSGGVAPLPDAAATGVEAAVPGDAATAAAAEVSADGPTVETGPDAAASPADASVDNPAAPFDLAPAPDSLPVATDAVAAEAVARVDATEALSRPDTDGLDAAKPADATAVEAAKPATDLAPAKLGEISPQDLHAALANKDFLLIDVHYPNAGSIPGTDARIAFDDIPALVASIGPDLNTKVVLTCLSGGMSKQAGDALVARGYRNISELTGGMKAWTAAGYQLVQLDGGL